MNNFRSLLARCDTVPLIFKLNVKKEIFHDSEKRILFHQFGFFLAKISIRIGKERSRLQIKLWKLISNQDSSRI